MTSANDQRGLNVLKGNSDIVLIFICWLISTFQGSIEYALAAKAYFLLLSISFVLMSYKRRHLHWLIYAFWELSIYNVFDELIGTADKFTWYEIPVIIFVLIHSLFKFKKRVI
jgi:hypothetical protein